jgi:hypothetical protein
MKKRESNSSVQQGKPVRRKYDEEFKRPWTIRVLRTLSEPIIKEQKREKTLATGQERIRLLSDTRVH